MSLHVALGGWTVGTDPQCVVPFARWEERKQVAQVEEDSYCLPSLFGQGSLEEAAAVESCYEQADESMGAAADTVQTGDGSVPSWARDLDPRMQQVLRNVSSIFTETPGCTTLVEHHIDTGDSPPVRCKLRPVNSKKQAIMDGCIDDLMAQGLIRRTRGRYASAPVLVEKKSGGYRLAVDYRSLNARTKVPAYPMPRTDWLLAQLGRARWFSSFDLSQGFFQIPVCDVDIEKTAFICHQGTFEFTRMPFGVAGGPATFQTLMDTVLEGVNHKFAMAFLDDVLFHLKTGNFVGRLPLNRLDVARSSASFPVR